MPKEVPTLEYDYNALEPHIDEQTMKIHHDKHHQAYADKLNAAIEGTEWADKPTCEILKNLDKVPADKKAAIQNNGGGHFNHSLFWKMISPNGGGEPSGALAEAINAKWGSFDSFKEEFEKAGATRFGSGWVWLCHDGKEIHIESTANQDNPISKGHKVLLGVDVWEHAYYLNYQNKRPDYLKAIWNVVNWAYIAERYDKAKACAEGTCGCSK